MDDVEIWLGQVADTLGIERELVTTVTGPVLDLVRDVAHDVVRPGAPMTAFLVGLAAGGASGPADASAVEARLRLVDGLVAEWRAAHPAP